MAGMLERKDLLNYSLVCKGFNAEATLLVWYGLVWFHAADIQQKEYQIQGCLHGYHKNA